MLNINKEIEKLLLNRSIYDSLVPLIEYCKDDTLFLEFLEEIDNKYGTQRKLDCYYTLAHLVRCHPSDEYEKTYTPSDFQESFRRFIISWDRLSFKKVPFEEWLDFAVEGISLLKTLIHEKKLETFKEDSRYRYFMKKFIQRHEDLRKSGKYLDLNELMDD